MTYLRITAALCCAFQWGCGGNEATEFPAGLEPLEENSAPVHQGGGTYPTELSLVSGETLDWKFVHARGYLRAPAGDVWAALKEPTVVMDVTHTDRQTFVIGTEPDYEWSYQLSYAVDEFITVEWDEAWRLGTVEGSPAAPTLAMVRYQKIFGTTFIDLLEGSILITAVPGETDITEVQFIEHLDAFSGGISDMSESMVIRFANMRAFARGEWPPAN